MTSYTKLPITTDVLVLRTDFSDDAAWKQLCLEIETPDSEFGFIPYVEFLSNIQFTDVSVEHIFEAIPDAYPHSFMFIVDRKTMSMHEHGILCVNLQDRNSAGFRVIPSVMWSVENNLSIANMDFDAFVTKGQTEDGVFRGF